MLVSKADAGELEWPYETHSGAWPIVIAHRGASGHLPEHSLAAYTLAMKLGADFIEPDLVMTKDAKLVARHDNYLSGSTDIAAHPEFADRRRKMNGRDDWFVEDFTLAELKRLRLKQAFPGRSSAFDGMFQIATFDEILSLVKDHEAKTGKRIGIYPETKQPDHFLEIGLDFVPPLIKTLEKYGYRDARDPVFIQSFEPRILRQLNEETGYRLIMLVLPKSEWEEGAPDDEPTVSLETAATFADGIGASKALVWDAEGKDRGFIRKAHSYGLDVHIWTFRDDQPAAAFANISEEFARIYSLGADGVFTDFTETAIIEREAALYRAIGNGITE